jgi:mono/diheme cytochrome c family protein
MAGSVDLIMMPKFSTSQIRIGAMMLKHVPLSSPNRNGAHREGDIMPATIGAMTFMALVCWGLSGLPAMAQANARDTGPQDPSRAPILEHGKYLVVIGHCNNCHTAGYGPAAGNVPEGRWLTGNPVGWRGKNGTTYGINLRLYMQHLSEDDWIHAARTMQPRPPMPWWSLRDMTDDDLKAMYWYIRSLVPVGQPAPAFLPPDQLPRPPYNQLPDMSLNP